MACKALPEEFITWFYISGLEMYFQGHHEEVDELVAKSGRLPNSTDIYQIRVHMNHGFL